MTTETIQKPGSERGMRLSELLELPVTFDLETANRAYGMGRTKGFQLAKLGAYPCRLIKIGAVYRVARADLLRSLGIDPNDSDAGAATPASVERTSAPTAK
ncbi:hypothetical protein [Streptomyces sp. NPDC020983]|uniref:hypothetical protein n=1 Tax=Streptomyces sp. NPDC020983 TaxID=3365106 RepID=UPI0037B9E754